MQTQICAALLTFQNFPSNAASPSRKCSPVGARVHQTARQRGVPSPPWRESQRGGVQLRGPGTPAPLLQVTVAEDDDAAAAAEEGRAGVVPDLEDLTGR